MNNRKNDRIFNPLKITKVKNRKAIMQAYKQGRLIQFTRPIDITKRQCMSKLQSWVKAGARVDEVVMWKIENPSLGK